MLAEMAPTVDGKPDITRISEIDLTDLGKRYRKQRIIFEKAAEVFDKMKPGWYGNREYLLAQLIRLVEQFLQSDKIRVNPLSYHRDELRWRVLVTLNMERIVQHIWDAIRAENMEAITPVFDAERPIRSTGDMRTWSTSKPCKYTKRSHINFCTYDSRWEDTEAFELDRNPSVQAWVKNDNLGFEIPYIFKGVVRKYRPDFLIRLNSGDHLVLEVKGQDTQQDRTKREFLDEWVRAVNRHGGFGRWQWAVSRKPSDVADILKDALKE